MTAFHYKDGTLHAESLPLTDIAKRFGTPCFIYSQAALTAAYTEFRLAFNGVPSLICYAVKASSNLAILNVFARLGSGFDIVSGGELARVLAAGGDPRKVVFSGVGKTVDEIRTALSYDILCFNVESAAELAKLNAIAGTMKKKAAVSLRVNPDVDPKTHPYIATGLKENKFGIPYKEALALYQHAVQLPHLRVIGVACHIGSQITELSPYLDALDKLLALVDQLQKNGVVMEHLDLGGGLGVCYRDESPIAIPIFAQAISEKLSGSKLTLFLEPGRVLTANAGILLTRVLYLKHGETKNFAVVDAAMNDLLRPALYDAYHEVLPVTPRQDALLAYEIVGPVCESADFLAHERQLALAEDDLLALASAGAYGMSMSSNYNTRPRACEVMVNGNEAHEIREREQVEALFAREKIPRS